jgi:hypothetical protein
MNRTRTAAVAFAATLAFVALPALAKDPPKPAKAKDKPAASAPAMSAEQKAMMEAYRKAGTPGAQHAAMAKMAGDYDVTIKSWEGPGDPMVEKGKASRKMVLGDRVMVEMLDSQFHGQPFSGHGMQGYDNVSGKYWSTWNDSMSTGVMTSEGDCDAAGACTFTGSWNDAVTKGKTVARMTTRWTSPTVEVFEMYAPGPDGKEAKMMEITYTRK